MMVDKTEELHKAAMRRRFQSRCSKNFSDIHRKTPSLA